MIKRLKYWNRIFRSYILNNISHLDFWHGRPYENPNASITHLGQYYMLFHNKANYQGDFDSNGIPMLNYQGHIGVQYNPIAISQWGLGNYNLWHQNETKSNYKKFINSANWLVENLIQNDHGLFVWMHNFDWEYNKTLYSPWYSGLAQGQGLSLLIRAYNETQDEAYKNACQEVIKTFKKTINEGGVLYIDKNGNKWIEEYILDPPTHILNGFIWALWGIYDYLLVYPDKDMKILFNELLHTIVTELQKYDTGIWSLYELSNNKIRMVASDFYHQLHIVQLSIMYNITKNKKFMIYSEKWSDYHSRNINRKLALIHKIIFKVFYY